ncbi:MAG: phosphatase PAP2 family protein [Nocardioidaceae bacterium]
MTFDPSRTRAGNARSSTRVLIVLGTVFGVLGILVGLRWGPILELDNSVAHGAYDVSAGHSRWVDALHSVQFWGQPTFLYAVVAVWGVAATIRRHRRVTIAVLAGIVVASVASSVVKQLVHRARPHWRVPLETISGHSFPSGHATAAGFFAVLMAMLTISAFRRGMLRRLLVVGWALIAVVVGLDRIFLGVHNTSDVVAGWALGALVGLGSWQLFVVHNVLTPAPLTTIGPAPSRFAVVYNPTKIADQDAFEALVEQAATLQGWQSPSWYPTTATDPGVGMTEAALAEGVDMVLAVGGDGTVRVVCSELARTGVPVGIVPLGTGNLLVRNLELPLHAGDAVNVALSGQDRAVDIVEVTGDGLDETRFTVMAGLGLDAAIMQGAPEDLKARMGWTAYAVSALRQVRYPATRVEITVDDGTPIRRRARTVVVGNVGLLQAGIPLIPDASIDDGLLDVVVIAPRWTLGWVGLIVRVMGRRRRTDASLDRMVGRHVTIRAEKQLPRQLDGDPIGEGHEIRASVLAGTLLVRVPR